MCGINGVIEKKGQIVDEIRFNKMRDSLIHRGPDSFNSWISSNIGLGHRRLSILDVSENGKQPFTSADGRYTIVFNGEIYNYSEFKSELTQKGYKFISNSDTEVLLYLFIEYGDSMLDRLNGMFAFSVWDSLEEKMFIARDRVGVKPFYYFNDNDLFAFASEPKALFTYGVKKEIDSENLTEWLIFRYVAGAQTLFKNVQVLLPGHCMILDKKSDFTLNIYQWWNLSEKILNHSKIEKPLDWFRETFSSSIKYRMISDVPVGILLSGGLDSSSVAASVSQLGYKNINTFNVGFKNFVDDESTVARNFSDKLGMTFHGIYMDDMNLDDLYRTATYIHDEPLIHQNDPHLVAIAKYAKKYVTVLQSGEGSDELMGGYVRYKALTKLKYSNYIRAVLKIIPENRKNPRLKKLEKYLSLKGDVQKMVFNSSNYYPLDYLKYGLDNFEIKNQFRYEIVEQAKKVYPKDPLRQTLYLDQHTYLCSLNNRNDRTTMSASIECREPFLDYRLIEGIGSLSNDWFIKNGTGKFLLRESMAEILGKEVTGFRKIGFSIPWLQTLDKSPRLKEMWNNLHKSEVFKIGILHNLDIEKVKRDYDNGDKSNESLLRHLLMLALWYNVFFEENV
jgi:asparagine synthase (glutamine-hydrolysing)